MALTTSTQYRTALEIFQPKEIRQETKIFRLERRQSKNSLEYSKKKKHSSPRTSRSKFSNVGGYKINIQKVSYVVGFGAVVKTLSVTPTDHIKLHG